MKKNIIINTVTIFAIIIFMTLMTYISLGGPKLDYDVYDSLYGTDGNCTEAVFRSIQEDGINGLFFMERVGAPEIQTSHDALGLDLITGFFVVIINFIFRPTTARLYYYFLYLTFILAAIGMWYLLYKLKINNIVNATVSILFALAPYHFYRYMLHIALSNYYPVPLVILLIFIYLGIIEVSKKEKIITSIVCGILIGLGNPYYVFFGLILIALAYIYKIIDENKFIISSKALVLYIPIIVSFILTRIPTMIYYKIHGTNYLSFVRAPYEQELFGLKIIQLFLPVTYSRNPFFKNISSEYYKAFSSSLTENYMSSLGIIGSIGLILLCVLFIILFINNSFLSKAKFEGDTAIIKFSGLSVLSLILVGSIGGFGEIFNYLVTAQIRCYNRCSIVIECFALILVAIFLNKIDKKKIIILASICVLILGIYDQLYVYDTEYIQDKTNTHKIYSDFFSKIENDLPANSMIYQLPYASYPEGGDVVYMKNGKHFVGYLFTNTLRWSYAGIVGREEYAHMLNVDKGMSLYFIAAIKEAGFNAVYIDRDGFEDDGEAILDFYMNSLGLLPVVSADDRLYCFYIDALELTLPENNTIAGFDFVNDYITKYSNIKNDALIQAIALNIENDDLDTIKNLYQLINMNASYHNLNNDQKINYIYQCLLNRQPNANDLTRWHEYLDNGYEIEGVFYSLFYDPEFKSLHNLNVNNIVEETDEMY